MISLLLSSLIAFTAAVPTTNDASLERALEAVSPERIAADLHFIASDALEGRDTPSRGQRIAARFIRARLQRLGWDAGAEDGYFHEYSLPMYAIDEEATVATLGDGSTTLSLGSDWAVFPGFAGTAEVDAGIVFVGDWADDGPEFDVEDKWALCYSGEDNFRDRLRKARRGDAAGLLIAAAPGDEADMGDRVRGYAEQLREPRLGSANRRSRTPYVYLTAKGLDSVLAAAGVDEPSPGQELGSLDFRMDFGDAEGSKLENVVGLWPGSHPELRNEVLIVSAHYDHVGMVEQTGEIFNGADDNGSGTCGLLALAEALTAHGPMQRSVLLIWVSGEEKGLHGSRAWAQDPWLPEGMRPVLDLNIDMIGRNAPEQLLITPTKKHSAYNFLTRVAEKHAESEGFTDLGSADAYWSRSDHAMFYEHLDIPVAFLFSDVHEDYHKTTDTPDKIDYDKASRVVRLVVRMLADLQQEQLEQEG